MLLQSTSSAASNMASVCSPPLPASPRTSLESAARLATILPAEKLRRSITHRFQAVPEILDEHRDREENSGSLGRNYGSTAQRTLIHKFEAVTAYISSGGPSRDRKSVV